MSKKPRDNRPYLPPVTRIHLSEDNVRQRVILILLLLTIAVVAIGYGFYTALNVQPGWNQIHITSTKPNCGTDFNLMYDFSESGGSASAVNKALSQLYSQSAEEAFLIFSADVSEEGVGNVRYLNDHVNEPITVDAALYEALLLLERNGNRSVFLAPVYVEYNRMFRSENDAEAALYDPVKDAQTAELIRELMTYVSDPEAISLEILENQKVCLKVSQSYLNYARENGVETFLEFGWLKNAFQADYMARKLTEGGFTKGYLVSYDGFTRNLDERGETFRTNIFDRQENTVYLPAELQYSGPKSIVFLRDYPMSDRDRWHYYAYENGDIRTVMLNPESGMSMAAIDSLVSYSADLSCAEVLLQMLDVYMADDFSEEAVQELVEQGIYSIWCNGNTVKYNAPTAQVNLLDTGIEAGYEIAFKE